MLANLDTSDGHAMWWGNDLWVNSATTGSLLEAYVGDMKSPAYASLGWNSEVMIVVHENGVVRGLKSWYTSGPGTLLEFMSGGDNGVLGSSVSASEVTGLWSKEMLVRPSAGELLVNRCIGGGCTAPNAWGSPDGARLGTLESMPSHDNGGGIGVWADMGYCCAGDTYAGKPCNGQGSFRVASEAGGWYDNYASRSANWGSVSCSSFEEWCRCTPPSTSSLPLPLPVPFPLPFSSLLVWN